MSLRIGQSDTSGATYVHLGRSVQAAQKAVGRLSSATKLVTLSDDAGGNAVYLNLSAALKRLSAAESNLMNADSFLKVQDGALKKLGELVVRMQELKTLSLDITKNSGDIANYSMEFWSLASEISVVGKERFNGIPLFSDTNVDQFLKCQSHQDGGMTIDLVLPPLSSIFPKDFFSPKIYSIVRDTMHWADAKTDAENRNGYLATITSPEEWDEIIRQLGKDEVTRDPLWFGLYQTSGNVEPNGSWEWITSESSAYLNWKLGEPDNNGVNQASQSADALAWNQPASIGCTVSGHMGDEVMANANGLVTGYVIEFTDSSNATKYHAVRSAPMSWDAARVAAYAASSSPGVLPAGSSNSHLATLKTWTEFNAAKMQIEGQGVAVNEMLWLGGYQALPAGVAETRRTSNQSWYWISDTTPGNGQVNPSLDDKLVWTMNTGIYSHGGQPDNLSATVAVQDENVGYISGDLGQWADSIDDPIPKGVKGYLMEQENDLTKIPLSSLQRSLDWVSHYRALCGAEAMQIGFALESVRGASIHLGAAAGRISDLDIAEETVSLTHAKILSESGAHMLTVARDAMEVILTLINQAPSLGRVRK